MTNNTAHGLPERSPQPHPLWSRRARHYDDDDGCEQPSSQRQPRRRSEGPPQDIVIDDEASMVSRITTPTFVTATTTSTTIESPPPPNHQNNNDDTTIKSVGATSSTLPPPSKEGDTLNSINKVDIEEADDDDEYDRASAYSAPFPPPESLGPSHSNFPQSAGGSTVYPGAVAQYPSNGGRVRSPESLIVGQNDNDNIWEERRQQQQQEGQLPEAQLAEDYVVTEAVAITRPTSLVQVDCIEKDEYDDDTERIHSTSTTTGSSFLDPILGKFSKRTRLIMSIVVLIGLLSVIIAVTVGVATSRVSGDGDDGATTSQNPPLRPTMPPTTTAQNHLKEYVDALSSQHNITVDRRDLSNMSSPQYKALSWLAIEDEFISSPGDPDMLERYILAVFYFSTDGDNWDINNQWFSEKHICKWWGVVGCTNNERVTLFDMEGNGLRGTLPTELGSLQFLNGLFLDYNNIAGTFPSEFGMLSLLQDLWMGTNQLTGAIPVEIGGLSKITTLSIVENKFTGPIPTQIEMLKDLVNVDLSLNALSGTIPAGLGNLSKLTLLHGYVNLLTGPLPTQPALMTKFRHLALDNNALTGTIPTHFGSQVNFTTFYVHQNMMVGQIPSELGLLSQLVEMYIDNNMFTGKIPTEFGNLSKLAWLDFYANDLKGNVNSIFCDPNDNFMSISDVTFPNLENLEADCADPVNPEVICSCCSRCL